MSTHTTILKVAIFSRRNYCLDYSLPSQPTTPDPQPGSRALVPLGNQKTLGLIVSRETSSAVDTNKLKPIIETLDPDPLLTPPMIKLAQWMHRYYHHPLADCMASMLPQYIKQETLLPEPLCIVQTNPQTTQTKISPAQEKLLHWLEQRPQGAHLLEIQWAGFRANTLNKLIQNQLAHPQTNNPENPPVLHPKTQKPLLNAEQSEALNSINQAKGFQSFLLFGATGSGKTEVYLQAIQRTLEQGQQALVLVPEIALTPQTLARFQARFACPITVFHSQLNPKQRCQSWLWGASGQARIMIGTRSALLTPMPKLGLIVLDEEHDASYKQQTACRYHARDLALIRAKQADIPIIMGSATPTLESLHNADKGLHTLLRLPERAGVASLPGVQLIDCRQQNTQAGISEPLKLAIQRHLDQKNQVLLFLNRRGFAPVLLCHHCGWGPHCPSCERKMTFHVKPERLQCHPCDIKQPVPSTCPECKSQGSFIHVGTGTERTEEHLGKLFPDTPVLRIDKDSVRNARQLEASLNQILSGKPMIILGTQMLAKGHHFPQVSCVGILQADQGIYSTQLRALEGMAQLSLQVAGRAGRSQTPGEVYIQTHHPSHAIFKPILNQDYTACAQWLLQQRQEALMPPFAFLAALKAHGSSQQQVQSFLQAAHKLLKAHPNVTCMGPLPSFPHKLGPNIYEYLLLHSPQRAHLHSALTQTLEQLQDLDLAKKVRYNLDIDPLEV